jgi:cobalt-zinc-cadmium efflux system outer membrane protein
LNLALRGADGYVAAADARTRAAISAVRAAEGTRDDASRLGAIAETAYQAGEIGVTELVDAYRAAHEAELSIIELTGRANLAAIELELAQGGPR